MKVSNISRLPQVVPIILANGVKTSVNIMPKSRPDLPPGAKVDANWLALNPNTLVILSEAKPADNKTREVVSKETK